jgi:DNA-binding transcriptional LysR family regulator
MPGIGPMRVIATLARFAAKHRDIEFTIVDAALSRLSDMLLVGSLDAALVADVGRPDKRFRHCLLYRERIMVVAPRAHRFERLEAVRLSDLGNENLLFRTHCDTGDFFLQSCRRQGFEPRISHRIAREDWVQAMVASGQGVTIMPEFSQTDKATIARPLIEPPIVRQLSLLTVAGRQHEAAPAALIRALRAKDRQQADTNDARHSPMSFSGAERLRAPTDSSSP